MDINDECPAKKEQFFNVEKCLNLISDLNTSNLVDLPAKNDDGGFFKEQSESEKLIEIFRKTIDLYQEQPELLEPHLADLIRRLILIIEEQNISQLKYHTAFKFLYQLIKVAGFKHVANKFPHETDKLTKLVELLGRENLEDRSNWQTRFVLLVWLSIVILTPFDLAKFDSNPNETCISDRVYAVLLRSLDLHDSCQHVASYCLAKFLSRPDIIKSDKYLDQFVSDALRELTNVRTGITGSMDDIKLIGRLRALCYLYKFLPRNELKKRNSDVLTAIAKLELDKINRELVNHLIIKLAQRAGLALLPKPAATWRYKRGSRIIGSLADEICRKGAAQAPIGTAAATSTSTSASIATESPPLRGSEAEGGAPVNEEVTSIYDEPQCNWADSLESILSILFVAAQNSQTKIRWSAGKGIARIASRLNRDRASDVIDMVLGEFFNDTSSDFAWHGGCLALAEMSRNGLILKEKLADVVNVVANAILYDKIKGASPVGAHVRESACYVCWAMARSYEDTLLAPYIENISMKLLCTMLFDRELQCRRAASATFQELVGRQGTFNEEGINILTNVDYQNVGQRQFAYLHLAMQVASYGANYSEPFAKHLMEKKICHWDVKLRRLACDSMSALMLHLNQDFILIDVLPKLIEMGSQNQDNNSKHGAVLALAKVIGSLASLQFKYPEGLLEFVGQIVRVCEKQLKNKQQGPNFMEAIACMITSAERANFPFPDNSDTLKQWESMTLSTLNSDDPQLRQMGAQALLALYRTYYKQNKTSQDRLLTHLNKSLSSPNESSRCGGLVSLSRLGEALSCDSIEIAAEAAATTTTTTTSTFTTSAAGGLSDRDLKQRLPRTDADTPDIILMSLASYISKDTHEKSQGFVFAQAKAEACEAFVNFIRNLTAQRVIISSRLIAAGFDALLLKAEDYTFDRRGDIGVVVRRAAIRSLQELTLHLLSIGLTSLLDVKRVTSLLGRILQQAVSYNNSAREQAGLAFYKLIVSDLLPLESLPNPSYRDQILALFERYNVNDEFNWRDDSTPIFVGLLGKAEFSRDLWMGLIPAVGQESDLCAKQFRDSLSDYLLSLPLADRLNTLSTFLGAMESFQSHRMTTAGLIVADFLLSQGLMEGIDVEFQRRLLAFCWGARGSGADPKRLCAVVRLLQSALQFDADTYIVQ